MAVSGKSNDDEVEQRPLRALVPPPRLPTTLSTITTTTVIMSPRQAMTMVPSISTSIPLSRPESPYYISNHADQININGHVSSATKGILIGMLSAFSSAAFVAIVFTIVYLLRYTRKGRIILDRIGRPGEYDDEQAFAREEAEALETMDDLQRAEYLRAKSASDDVDSSTLT